MLAPTEEHPLDGADIAVIPAKGHGDMPVRRQYIVGGVGINPAIPWTVHGHPGVRRVCAYESGLTGWWLRDQIAADVARCQAKRPETADLHLGKVLTDTTASA
jgi:hypothetical protein